MSGKGQPSAEALSLDIDGTGLKVTIVSGLWHTRISEGLLGGARAVLDASGAEVTLVQVPGSFELPVAALVALQGGADAVVALGVIVRGETPHFDYVAAAATDGLTRVALDTGKPVGFGVLTVETLEQAQARSSRQSGGHNVGADAAAATIELAGFARVTRSS